VRFRDRAAAGRALAERLEAYRAERPVVLGLPRGGVVVAAEVAQHLGAPLDVIVVRKLGVPWQPELAMGAIGEDGVRVLDRRVLEQARIGEAELAAVEQRERQVLADRVRRLRGVAAPAPLADRSVLVVDDGIATGSTARAACAVARAHGAARIVLAVPVAPSGVESSFHDVCDEVIALTAPAGFGAVGRYYRDFGQTTDDEVATILAEARGSGHR